MKTDPSRLLVLVVTLVAALCFLAASAEQGPSTAAAANVVAPAVSTCTPVPAVLASIATPEPAATVPDWLVDTSHRFHGFCPCGCSNVPDCNTSADCFGGATCRTAPSCC